MDLKNIKMEDNRNIYEDDSKWCSCENPNWDKSTFHDDGEHDELYKHHWRCSCGKILQIG
jgi:hypothetical protein